MALVPVRRGHAVADAGGDHEVAVEVRRRRNVTPASSTLTSTSAPLAVQTPVPALKVDVTAPEARWTGSAAAFDSVKVAVTFALSTSLMTISVRLSGVSSV